MWKTRLFILAVFGLLLLGVQADFILAPVRSAPRMNDHSTMRPLSPSEAATLSVPVALGTPSIPCPCVTPQVPDPLPGEIVPSSVTPVGGPAIQPSLNDTDPSMPAFTEADVRSYHNRLPMRGFGERGSSVSPAGIVSIKFLTQRELKTLMPDGVWGTTDDVLLCYVQYTGTFILSSPFGPSKTVHQAMEIFNAHTGNMLVSGVGP